MFEMVSGKLTDWMVEKQVIDESDWEIYSFGVQRILSQSLSVMTGIVVGVLMGKLWQYIVFMLSFMTLRKYCGGYHASTQLRCYFLTIAVITSSLSVIGCATKGVWMYGGLFLISSAVILVFSPTETKNRQLDWFERKIFRRKALIRWGVEAVFVIICMALKMREAAICIVIAQSVQAVSLVAGNLCGVPFNQKG